MLLAKHVAGWSKDPSTQVGAVIVRDHRDLVSVGYNGFPPNVADDARLHDRDIKYELVLHAEVNAILNARERDLTGSHLLVWPLPPCVRCAATIVREGIAHVYFPPSGCGRWADSVRKGRALFVEAGVQCHEVEIY